MPVQTCQLSRRHTSAIERLDEEPTRHGSQQPVVSPAPVRNPYWLVEVGQLTGSAQASREFVVLQNRPGQKPAKGVEGRSTAEDPGIAIEDPEPPSPPVDGRKHPCRPILAVVANIEIAADDGRV